MREKWLAGLSKVDINRYPDPDCRELKTQIRAAFDIADDCDLVLGNGSDELIQMLVLLVGGGRVVLAPTPTFSMYRLITIAGGGAFIGVPLDADFHLDGEAILAAIAHHKPACIFFARPNNPSGNCFDETLILEVLSNAPGLVVVDEAYYDFCRETMLAHCADFPNLMVLRTLSKSGMAALRLGFLIAHPDWAAQIEKVRLPYNINALTQKSAAFYLAHHDFIQRQAADIVAQRAQVSAQLGKLRGVYPYPSDANFILFKLDCDGGQVYDRLKKHGVLVKNLHRDNSPLANCLRVTIGSEAENAQFLRALGESLT